MVMPGEIGHIGKVCEDCEVKLEADVHMSGAGYYIGTVCNCGPYSRESGYYSTRKEASAALDTDNFGRSNYPNKETK